MTTTLYLNHWMINGLILTTKWEQVDKDTKNLKDKPTYFSVLYSTSPPWYKDLPLIYYKGGRMGLDHKRLDTFGQATNGPS